MAEAAEDRLGSGEAVQVFARGRIAVAARMEKPE
jgi:hypothetical protein